MGLWSKKKATPQDGQAVDEPDADMSASADIEYPGAPAYHAAPPGDERSQDDMNSPGVHEQDVAHGDVALAEVPSAEPTTIQVAQPAPTSTPEEQDKQPSAGQADTPARAVTGLPAPLILVGNPRLGSNPAGLPRVPNATPDSVLDGARLANLTVRAASLRGDDHRHAAETRQDSIGLWAFDPPPWLETDVPLVLACVADGVGSHRLSHLGSARACSLLRYSVEAYLNDLAGTDEGLTTRTCRRVILDVAAGLRSLAADHSLEPKQVSTTLTACLVVTERKADEGALARAVLFNVGDSVSYLLRERRWIAIPDNAAGDGDGMVDTHTDALPTRPEKTQVNARTLYKDDMLMLCTDGLGGPLRRNDEVSGQLADWWTGQVPSLPEFYWQMSFRAQTYGDDRSAVCIWLHGDG